MKIDCWDVLFGRIGRKRQIKPGDVEMKNEFRFDVFTTDQAAIDRMAKAVLEGRELDALLGDERAIEVAKMRTDLRDMLRAQFKPKAFDSSKTPIQVLPPDVFPDVDTPQDINKSERIKALQKEVRQAYGELRGLFNGGVLDRLDIPSIVDRSGITPDNPVDANSTSPITGKSEFGEAMLLHFEITPNHAWAYLERVEDGLRFPILLLTCAEVSGDGFSDYVITNTPFKTVRALLLVPGPKLKLFHVPNSNTLSPLAAKGVESLMDQYLFQFAHAPDFADQLHVVGFGDHEESMVMFMDLQTSSSKAQLVYRNPITPLAQTVVGLICRSLPPDNPTYIDTLKVNANSIKGLGICEAIIVVQKGVGWIYIEEIGWAGFLKPSHSDPTIYISRALTPMPKEIYKRLMEERPDIKDGLLDQISVPEALLKVHKPTPTNEGDL